MRRAAVVVALLVLSAATLASSAPAGAAQDGTGPLARLAWLAGCWERRAGTRLVEEQWMRPRGAVMPGMSRTTRGDTLVEWEQVRIAVEGDTIFYHAQPSGQPAARFRLTAISAGSLTFENPAHDFPQRILYRAVGRDSLVARIEGTSNGRRRGVDFPYARVACPGA